MNREKKFVYGGCTVEIKGNILGLWEVYLDGVLAPEYFYFDFDAVDYAKNMIDSRAGKSA